MMKQLVWAMRHMLCAVLILFCAAAYAQSRTDSAMMKNGELWLDQNGVFINAHGGGLLKHKGLYYWFGEHKIAGDAGNYAQVGVHVYSSKDLRKWKDCGIALRVDEKDPNSSIAKGCILERPKVIYNARTKKFVMWFHLELKGKGYGSAFSGVATADKPCGPYTFLRAGRAHAGIRAQNHPEDFQSGEHCKFYKRDFEQGQMQRDMTLYVDDDKTAYHIYASEENYTLHVARLDSTYTAHDGVYIRTFENRSMEAPAIFKRNGNYYLIASGCSGWAPNAARSAVAKNMLGPWKELKNPCVGKDAHITFGGQSTYAFENPRKKGEFILMCDLWRPKNAIDGRYMWLPIRFEGEQPVIEYVPQWFRSK